MIEIDPSEYAPFYAHYISLVREDSILSGLENSLSDLKALLQPHIQDEAMGEFRYADDKWSIKQLILHLADSEMVFAQRILWALRKEKSPLPGFDHNQWVVENRDAHYSFEQALSWLETVRICSLKLLQTVEEDQLTLRVESNGCPFSVRSLGVIISGHTRHHTQIIAERYLK